MRRLLVLLLAWVLSGPALAEAPALYRASEIAKVQAASVRLQKGKDRQTVGIVSTARVRTLLEIKERIEKQAGVSAELALMEGREPNAFATPTSKVGPLVVLNLGMIELIGDDRDGYAAVLGHEYAHLALKHREKRQTREGLRQAGSLVLGLFLGANGVPLAGELSNLATGAVSTVFSRDEEREADAAGLRYAAASGHDPYGAVRVWERMSERGSRSIPFLSSHPAPAERVESMRSLAASLKSGQARP